MQINMVVGGSFTLTLQAGWSIAANVPASVGIVMNGQVATITALAAPGSTVILTLGNNAFVRFSVAVQNPS